MKFLVFTLFFLLEMGFLHGQNLSFKDNIVDTIEIVSHSSAYQFDEKGTTKGKTEILVITPLLNRSAYSISEYRIEKFSRLSREDSTKINKKWCKKYIGRAVERTALKNLLSALNTTETATVFLSSLSEDEFKKYTNKRVIKKVARKHKLLWHFRPWYSTRSENRDFFNACQSIDTFKLFLNETFGNEEFYTYPMAVDYSNSIKINLKTKDNIYSFEGVYQNPVRQPWYHLKTTKPTDSQSVMNLNINLTLYRILPQKFLLRESVSVKKLMDSYVLWYFNRKEMS